MKAAHLITGQTGEDLALEYLIKSGYEILATNWSANKAEIDIIYIEKDVLVFVEVKSRTNDAHPEKAVHWRKQKLLFSAASQFMESIQYDWKIRFDIIAITFIDDRHFSLNHYRDAFFPNWE